MGVSQASSMSRLDKKPRETRVAMIQDIQGVKHLDSCLGVLEASSREDICLYVLALLDTVCIGSAIMPGRVRKSEEIGR